MHIGLHGDRARITFTWALLASLSGCSTLVENERTFDRSRRDGPPHAEPVAKIVSGAGGQDAFGLPVEFVDELLLVGSAGLAVGDEGAGGIQEAGGALLIDPASDPVQVHGRFHSPRPWRGAGTCSGVTFSPLAGVSPPCVGVAAEGATVVLGLGNESVTVDGTTTPLAGAGAAYVFEQGEDGAWSMVQELTAGPLARENDAFGFRVALSGDLLAVSAPWDDEAGVDAGAVYVFRKRAGSYALDGVVRPELPRRNDLFGIAVDLEGDLLVASAPIEAGSGQGVDADPAARDSVYAGAVYAFTLSEGGYEQEAYLKPTDPPTPKLFGASLALQGSTLAVGAPGFPDGSSVYVYERDDDGWRAAGEAVRPDDYEPSSFGSSVALDGNLLVVGAPNDRSSVPGVHRAPVGTPDESVNASGAAHVFERTPLGFRYAAYLKSDGPLTIGLFGSSVAVSRDLVAIGAPADILPATNSIDPRSGAVHLFRHLPGD